MKFRISAPKGSDLSLSRPMMLADGEDRHILFMLKPTSVAWQEDCPTPDGMTGDWAWVEVTADKGLALHIDAMPLDLSGDQPNMTPVWGIPTAGDLMN